MLAHTSHKSRSIPTASYSDSDSFVTNLFKHLDVVTEHWWVGGHHGTDPTQDLGHPGSFCGEVPKATTYQWHEWVGVANLTKVFFSSLDFGERDIATRMGGVRLEVLYSDRPLVYQENSVGEAI